MESPRGGWGACFGGSAAGALRLCSVAVGVYVHSQCRDKLKAYPGACLPPDAALVRRTVGKASLLAPVAAVARLTWEIPGNRPPFHWIGLR